MNTARRTRHRGDGAGRLRAGGNGGWDPVPGYNESTPMTDLAKFPEPGMTECGLLASTPLLYQEGL